MKAILNHKTRVKASEDIINNLMLVKSYLEVKNLQEYIDYEDVLQQLSQSIRLSQKLYNELLFLYREVIKK